MKNITVVSDPGVDDVVALALLAKLLPKVQNHLIACFGNAPQHFTARNAQEFIAYAASEWRYSDGSKMPYNGKLEHPWPDYFHGHDGLWSVHPDVSIDRVVNKNEVPQNREIISLGPLTDVYPLIQTYTPQKITMMGGVFKEKGNETEYAEFNIALDPDSASLFFENCSSIEVNVVSLDVTRKTMWTFEMVKNIPETNDLNSWIKKILLAWYKNYNHEKEKNFNLHDPLAIFLHFFPEHTQWKKSGVGVITQGKRRGQTVIDKNNPPCNIATDLVNTKKISEKIYSLITQ